MYVSLEGWVGLSPGNTLVGPDYGTPPLLEWSEALLLEFWSGSEERLSRFFGGLKGGELPSFHCLSTPLLEVKEISL